MRGRHFWPGTIYRTQYLFWNCSTEVKRAAVPILLGCGSRFTEMQQRSRLPLGLCCEDLIIKSNDFNKVILQVKSILQQAGD